MTPDVSGKALKDYLHGKRNQQLLLHIGYGDTEDMPVEEFFRHQDKFPEIEDIALGLCDGKTLDVGAGAGRHSLCLQSMGIEVTALEYSPLACEVMRERGVKRVIEGDFLQYNGEQYDTLLFMMNGIGIAGTIEGLKKLLDHCKTLLNEGGQLIFDSSDLAYLYIDGTVPKPTGYYGEINYQYEYEGIRGIPFNWLFVDQETLIRIAHPLGWIVQVLYEDGNDQYLARMERINH